MDDVTKRLEQYDRKHREKMHERYGVGWVKTLLLLLGGGAEGDAGDGGGVSQTEEPSPRSWRWRGRGRVRLRVSHVARFTDGETGETVVVPGPEPGPRTFTFVSEAHISTNRDAVRRRAEESILLLE